MALKGFIANIWRSYKLEAILSSVGFGAIVVLIYYTYPASLAPSDTVQTITLIVLVIVTVSYAISTRKMYQVALNAEMNTVAPVVNIEVDFAHDRGIRVIVHNVGRGPALNFRMWLEADDSQFWYLKSDRTKDEAFRTAVAADQSGPYTWTNDMGPLPERSGGFDIIAQYSDVHHRSFATKLAILDHYQELSYGIASQQR